MNTHTLFTMRGVLKPINFPFMTWKQYAQNTYTDEQVPTEKGHSTGVGLRRIGDPVYLLCEKAQKKQRFVFWSDIDHIAPKKIKKNDHYSI